MSKKSTKKKPIVEKAKAKTGKELSEKDLEQVAGGTANYLMMIDGVAGESHSNNETPTESISLNFAKVHVEYKPQR